MALSLSPAARDTLKNILICLSLANLCFSRQWYELEQQQAHAFDYYRDGPPTITLFAATCISAIAVAAIFAIVWILLKRTAPRIVQALFLLVTIYPLESVRRFWNGSRYDLGANIALGLLEAVLAAGCILALAGNDRILRAARRAVLLLAVLIPAVLLDFTSFFLGIDRGAFKPRPTAQRFLNAPKRRVLWILYDELDQRAAFERRPASIQLPELDRLRAESFSASESKQTEPSTLLAIPSLFSGRPVVRAATIDAGTLRIREEGTTQDTSWRDQPNIFRRARQMGLNAAIDGWYHPYCRLFGDQLVDCFRVGAAPLLPDRLESDDTIGTTVGRIFSSLIARDDARIRAETAQRLLQDEYFRIHNRALAYAADASLNLVFIHYPTPHPLGIYDRRRGDFTISDSSNYLDNVALVDRSIGELRTKLQSAGLAESTTLLITSDHGLRPKEWRKAPGWNAELENLTGPDGAPIVPFLVNIGGASDAIAYHKEFSNIVSGDLILAILSGAVSTHSGVASWLDQHSAITTKTMR